MLFLLIPSSVPHSMGFDGYTSEDSDYYYKQGWYFEYSYSWDSQPSVMYESGRGYWNDPKPVLADGLYSSDNNPNSFDRYIGPAIDYGFKSYNNLWAGELKKINSGSLYRQGVRYIKYANAYYAREKTKPVFDSINGISFDIEGSPYINKNDYWIKPNQTLKVNIRTKQSYPGIVQLNDYPYHVYLNLAGSNSPSRGYIRQDGNYYNDSVSNDVSISYNSHWQSGDKSQLHVGFNVSSNTDNKTYIVNTNVYSANSKWYSPDPFYKDTGLRIKTDGTAPKIDNFRYEDTDDGFYVYCDVADSGSGVKDIYLAPYTQVNGADDLVSNWRDLPQFKGTKVNGSTYRWFVPRAEHKGEYGNYYLEFYAYDNVGNRNYRIASYDHNNPVPVNGSLTVKKSDYKESDTVYWVKPKSIFEVETTGYFPSSYGVYPTRTYLLFGLNGINPTVGHFADVNGKSPYGYEFSNSFEFINDGNKAIKSQKDSKNYLSHTHNLKAKNDGDNFKLYYFNSFIVPVKVTSTTSKYDVNGDGVLDSNDLTELSKSYDSKVGDNNYNKNFDVNGDGIIDIFDIVGISKNIQNKEYSSEFKDSYIWLKVDGIAPKGTVGKNYNKNTSELKLSVNNIIETGSGVKEIIVEYTDKNNLTESKKEILVNKNGFYEGGKNLYDLFKGNADIVNVKIIAYDKVGNYRELFNEDIDVFNLEANIVRVLSPHDPVFKNGEKGILKIYLYGGVDKIKVTFPTELSKLDENLNFEKILIPKNYDEVNYEFIVPLEAPEDKYNVQVKAYKNGKEKIVYPPFSIKGNILDNIRTRIRR